MNIVISDNKISLVFKSKKEKIAFLESKKFKDLVDFDLKDLDPIDKSKDFDWNKLMKDHPEIWNPVTYPIPNQIKDPPIDVTPYIDDPVRFPDTSTTEDPPSYYHTFTKTIATQNKKSRGGCDATPKYGKATVDWPSKYPCEADPDFLK